MAKNLWCDGGNGIDIKFDRSGMKFWCGIENNTLGV